MKRRTLLGLFLLLVVLLCSAAAEKQMPKEYADRIDSLYEQYGDFRQWSAQQRAELSKIEQEAGCQRDGSPIEQIFRVPDTKKGEQDEESARKLAKEALAQQDLTASRRPIRYAFYYALPEKEQEPMWEVLFEAPIGQKDLTVFLDAEGKPVKTVAAQNITLFDQEGNFIVDILQSLDNISASGADISARQAARTAVKNYNEQMGETKQGEEVSVTGGLKNLNGRHVWLIRLIDGNLPLDPNGLLFDTVIDAKDDEVIYHTEREAFAWRGQEYRRARKLIEQFKQDGCLLNWSLEKQYAAWPDLLSLPEEGDISQDEARQIAKDVLQKEAELSDRFFDRYQSYTLFEKDDRASNGKAWHVAFALPSDLPHDTLVYTNIYGFNVWIDAGTGQTLAVSTPRQMAFCAHFYQYDDGTASDYTSLNETDNIAHGLSCPATGLAISKNEAEKIARETLEKALPKVDLRHYEAYPTHVLQKMQEYFVVRLEGDDSGSLSVAMTNDGTVRAQSMADFFGGFNDDTSHWPLSVQEKAARLPDLYDLPKEGDLSEKEALDISARAIKKHFALTDQDLAQLVPTAGISINGTRRWEICWFPKEQADKDQYLDCYTLDIDIVTGDLLCYHSPSESNG